MKLYRPAIPVEVRCRVVLRQLGEMFIDDVIRANRFTPRVVPPKSLGMLLDKKLAELAGLLNCETKELRLDHDPALALRPHIGSGKETIYSPEANDPRYLDYRPHGAEHAGSHDVKTRIRGDHGQYSDITLIKRERRRERRATACKEPAKKARGLALTKPKTKWPKRSFPKRK